MAQRDDKHRIVLLCLALALITFIAFEQVCRNEFVIYDDDAYVTGNLHVNRGLTRESVFWAFTTPHGGISYWHPLTWLSHMLDCQLFGLDPGWHHLTNLLLHIANTILLFLVLQKMTGGIWRSTLVAALFGFHPLHVESVAWVAERKDVLSGFFFMLTIAAYIRYVEHPKIGRYLLIVLAFTLGLMAKPMLVTLPFVLLLLDYWPLGRFKTDKIASGQTVKSIIIDFQWKVLYRLILEKVPLFALAAVLSVVTFLVQRRVGAMAQAGAVSLGLRLGNALIVYLKYMRLMILPSKLAVFYPHFLNRLSMQDALVAGLLLVCISVWIIRSARSRKYLPVGWLWFIGTLVPVIGLVQVGGQGMADRYTYLPSIGIFIMIAWGAGELFANWANPKKIVLVISIGLMLTALLVYTRIQVRYWRNSTTLFEHALDVTENNYMAHYNIGNILVSEGKLDEAIIHFGKALKFRPNWSNVYYALGNVLGQQGKSEEASLLYQKALQIRPGDVSAHNNLANILAEQGKLDEAIRYYRQALQLNPYHARAHCNLGYALLKQDNLDEAIICFRQAHQLKPDWPLPLNALARTLAMDTDPNLYDTGEAIKFAERAAELTKYQDAGILETLAVVFAAAGEFDRAITTVQSAIALAVAGKNDNLVNQLRTKLESYKQGKP